MLEVEAWVVDIRNAACADDAGILNPLLHRYQARLSPSPHVCGACCCSQEMLRGC